MSRTLDEIGQHSRTGRKEIGRTYKRVMKDLGIRILPTPPAEYVPRFASQLQLDAPTQALASRILEYEQVGALGTGRGPTGLAAAAVYLATRINGITRTQRDVATAAGVEGVNSSVPCTVRGTIESLRTQHRRIPCSSSVTHSASATPLDE